MRGRRDACHALLGGLQGVATIAAMDLRDAIRDHRRVRGRLLLPDTFLDHRITPEIVHGGGSTAEQAISHAPGVIFTAQAGGIPRVMAAA